jgi:hypothetical protein
MARSTDDNKSGARAHTLPIVIRGVSEGLVFSLGHDACAPAPLRQTVEKALPTRIEE